MVHVIDVQGFVRFPAVIEDVKREGERLVKAATDKLSRSGHNVLVRPRPSARPPWNRELCEERPVPRFRAESARWRYGRASRP